ncbi:PAS-domain containing protein [Breoghania sp.]|uniref:PAS-domain containing protein n=1 Tax=Breoghania sp. TaxID=2065378 RepID=UPI0026305BFD|nr:PAS-domain containing protein [Breoghania sp.]MDJ0933054.1 PAS-domain containing protein [Breoghania sp.]
MIHLTLITCASATGLAAFELGRSISHLSSDDAFTVIVLGGAIGLSGLCFGFIFGRCRPQPRTDELHTIRERLEQQSSDIDRLAEEAQDARTTLLDAIESTQEGFSIFDDQDRLVLCNAPFRALYPEVADQIRPGATFRDLIRAAAQAGIYGPIDDLEAFIEHRATHRRSWSFAAVEESLADGRWIRISNRITRTAGSSTC